MWRRGVAQLGSAPASGAGGRWFKSSRPDHFRVSCRNRSGRGHRVASHVCPRDLVDRRSRRRAREMNAAGGKCAAEILVQGRVQGVGYRAFVQRKAGVLGLAGYVMNLKTGNVRVRVEGGRQSIEELARDPRRARRSRASIASPSRGGRRPAASGPSASGTRSSTRDGSPRGGTAPIGAALLLPGLLTSHPVHAEAGAPPTPSPRRTSRARPMVRSAPQCRENAKSLRRRGRPASARRCAPRVPARRS